MQRKINRKKKLALNTASALVYQFITMVCGFVLPKFVIPYFGSTTNGLINSITQFLTIITLCECGVGAVVQSSLYKPLADGDDETISKIMISSRRFFNMIMKALGVYIILLIIIYPIILKSNYSYSWIYTSSLIVILAFSYVAQYYLFLSYRLLLNADQASYIQLSIHSVVLVLNTIVTIVLIKVGSNVHIVKLGSALVFLIQPVFLRFYVERRYKLNWKLKYTEEPIKQKWNGLAQHIASVVLGNTDTVVLTLFSTLENVSIYSVYYLVTHGIRQVIVSFNTGIQAMLGNMLAKNEMDLLDKTYSAVEWVFHTIVTYLFSVTGVLILPFVTVYTNNFNDANYITPVFGILMVAAQAFYCIRIPYETMIRSAGHYKQTQCSSIIEAGINIVSSIILVFKFGLVGVAIGTLAAMTYRTIYLVIYLSHNILNRNIIYFVKNICVDFTSVVLIWLLTKCFSMHDVSYASWLILSIKVAVTAAIIVFIVNYVSYRKTMFLSIKKFLRK